jgi:hypothetical protein
MGVAEVVNSDVKYGEEGVHIDHEESVPFPWGSGSKPTLKGGHLPLKFPTGNSHQAFKEQDLAVDDYVRFFGSKFAPGWEELADQPLAVARTVARNAVSVGGTLRSLSGGEEHAEVIVEGWPDEAISGVLGLERDDGEVMWDSFKPIMEHLGVRYSWGHEVDGAVRLTFERGSA